MMKKRIFVIVKGRNGNQLFQYAFARAIQEQVGGELIFDFSELGFDKSKGKYGSRAHMENVLDFFNVRPYTYSDVGTPFSKNCALKCQFFLYRLFRKLYKCSPGNEGRVASLSSSFLQRMGIYYQYGTHSFLGYRQPSITQKNLLIRGWFESAAYFKSIEERLREELTLSMPLSNHLEDIKKRLLLEESVCVHVRRGDFLSDAYKKEFHVCDIDYYKKGVSLITEKHPNLLLFVCSDDIGWCKEFLFKGVDNIIYEPQGLSISDTMHLMTACHHFVISNSTLSFWMQYLSNHPDKMVVAPSIWRRCDPPVKDIFMKEWILVDCK